MGLGAIYLWEPEISGAEVPKLDQTERNAYELYQQHRDTLSHGLILQRWIDTMIAKMTDPQYSEYFSAEIIQWVAGWQDSLHADPCAMIEVEHFDLIAQGDALYRVFYEAVQSSGVGCYEPRFGVWSNGHQQVPYQAIDAVLHSYLAPLSTQSQSFDLNDIKAPRNMKKAAELTQQWFAQHPYTRHFKFYAFNCMYDFIKPTYQQRPDPENAPDRGMRYIILTNQVEQLFYQISLSIFDLTSHVPVDITLDLTQRFIPVQLQEKLGQKLAIRIYPVDIRTDILSSKGYYELMYKLNSRWDEAVYITEFFTNLDAYITFVLSSIGQGQLNNLQAWAYGNFPPGMTIGLQPRFRLMVIALSADANFLQQLYQHYKQDLLDKVPKGERTLYHSLESLETDYLFFQEVIDIVKQAGTALPLYQKN